MSLSKPAVLQTWERLAQSHSHTSLPVNRKRPPSHDEIQSACKVDWKSFSRDSEKRIRLECMPFCSEKQYPIDDEHRSPSFATWSTLPNDNYFSITKHMELCVRKLQKQAYLKAEEFKVTDPFYIFNIWLQKCSNSFAYENQEWNSDDPVFSKVTEHPCVAIYCNDEELLTNMKIGSGHLLAMRDYPVSMFSALHLANLRHTAPLVPFLAIVQHEMIPSVFTFCAVLRDQSDAKVSIHAINFMACRGSTIQSVSFTNAIEINPGFRKFFSRNLVEYDRILNCSKHFAPMYFVSAAGNKTKFNSFLKRAASQIVFFTETEQENQRIHNLSSLPADSIAPIEEHYPSFIMVAPKDAYNFRFQVPKSFQELDSKAAISLAAENSSKGIRSSILWIRSWTERHMAPPIDSETMNPMVRVRYVYFVLFDRPIPNLHKRVPRYADYPDCLVYEEENGQWTLFAGREMITKIKK